MAPLIGITGEQKPASALVDVLDVLRTRNIDVFYGDYARAVVAAGGMPVWVPIDAPPAVLDRIDGLLLSGGDDIDPGAYGHEPIRRSGHRACCATPRNERSWKPRFVLNCRRSGCVVASN